LIVHPDYIALKADGAYAQAAWLARQLDRPATMQLELLRRAAWGTTNPETRRRTLSTFVDFLPDLVEQFPKGTAEEEMTYIQWQQANALRELGRFEEASAVLEMIAAKEPEMYIFDPDSMFPTGSLVIELQTAIAHKEMDRFPVNLLPERLRREVCSGQPLMPDMNISARTLAACVAMQEVQNVVDAPGREDANSVTTDSHEIIDLQE
jgi:hypothetical protein